MNSAIWLKESTHKLLAAGIDTARLDALVLLEDVSGHDRAHLLAHPAFELSAAQIAKLEILLSRRVRHEPLAYIRGHVEFYGREFVINHNVLIPRPESETMIELLKGLCESGFSLPADRQTVRIADVGTGCGALGITAALEVPNAQVELLDIDPAALDIAKINVDKLTPHTTIIESDLLDASQQCYDVLLCNLPYVPDDYQINKAARHEPKLALFGGPDGLNIYRRLFTQLQRAADRPLYILTEALPEQHSAIRTIAEDSGYFINQTEDFIQQFSTKIAV